MTKRQIAWLYVGAQFVLLLAIVFTPGRNDWDISLGVDVVAVLLGIVGLAVGLWAILYLGRGLTPLPLPNGQVDVVSDGPYRLVRHPMYLAVMLFALALTLRSGSLVVVAEFVLLVALFAFKARWEEAQLEEAMPEYAAYRATTPRFVPALRR